MTSKLWEVMNDLESVTSKICSAREIIDAAIDRIQEHEYDKAETMMSAAYEFLEYYLGEFDEKFKLAWKETVVKQKQEENDAWDAVNKEREYYEGNTHLTCDKDDSSPECQKSWNDFWGAEDQYYPHPDQPVYTEEELSAMCDKAASDEEKEKCREYNLREAEYYDKRAQLDATYNAMIAKGYTMTDDGFWIHNLRTKEDKVKRWVLPVEEAKDVDTDETDYFVSFPDDLLEAANLKEGDQVQWVDNGNGSYTITKVTKPLRMDEC